MENNVLKVMIWGQEAGTLVWDKDSQRAFFTYNMDFIKNDWDLSPLSASIYSQRSQRQLAHYGNKDKLYAGLPEFIADSLPDLWGNTIFGRWAANQNISTKDITAVDRLSFIGKRGMGALEFEPAFDNSNPGFTIKLKSLYNLADQIFNERQDISVIPSNDLLIETLYKVGTSAGGMHPKAIIAINDETGEIRSGQADLPPDFTHYIIKFDESKQFPHTRVEKAYYDMATAAGVQMMPSRLIEIEGKQHFLTQRFDRKSGRKIHTQTLAAMNSMADTYEDLFTICRKLGLSAEEQVQQYRRTVFNILAGNTDDHTKNFSFLMNQDGVWHIAPAYDMTFTIDVKAPDFMNRHSMSLRGKMDNFSKKDLIDFAKINGIKNPVNIIDDINNTICHFKEFAEEARVPGNWINEISRVLDSISHHY